VEKIPATHDESKMNYIKQHLWVSETQLLRMLAECRVDLLSLHQEEGKWTIADQFAHITRYQEHFLWRMETILLSERALFDRYIAEEDTEFPRFQAMSIADMKMNFSL
jgi:hypothetical protein